MRPSATLLGVIAITAAIIIGPYLTAPGYSSVTNAISELGAQSTPNAWMMFAISFAWLVVFLPESGGGVTRGCSGRADR